MGAFVAALPAIEIAATELPQVINLGLEIVNGLKGLFHKTTPDQKLTPVQVSTVQAMSLAGMRAKLVAAFPDVSAKLTDAQVQMFIEILYQSQKAVTAAAPVVATAAGIPGSSGLTPAAALNIVNAALALWSAFTTMPAVPLP